MLESVSSIFFDIVFYYFFIINSIYAILIVNSIPLIAKRFQEVSVENIESLLGSESLPSMTIVVPAYNMEKTIIDTIYNLVNLSYPSKEVIIVNDGSTDGTWDRFVEEFKLKEIPRLKPFTIPTAEILGIFRSEVIPELICINKKNSGRSDSINVGINISTSQLLLIIDADTVVENDALLRMARPFLTDPNIVGQGATLRILNGCRVEKGSVKKIEIPDTMVEGIQVVEYLRAFLYGRLGWNAFCGPLIISGAFGLFKRDKIIDAGGYDTKSIGEDFDLTMALLNKEYSKNNKRPILFIPDPIAWTEIPRSFKALGKQRARWHQGLCQVMYKFRHILFNPRYGYLGLFGFPYMFFGELLEPFFELVGYFTLFIGIPMGYLPIESGIIFVLVAFGITTILTFVSIVMELSTFRRYHHPKQLLSLVYYSLLENFGYRQLYIYWRFRGLYRFFKGSTDW